MFRRCLNILSLWNRSQLWDNGFNERRCSTPLKSDFRVLVNNRNTHMEKFSLYTEWWRQRNFCPNTKFSCWTIEIRCAASIPVQYLSMHCRWWRRTRFPPASSCVLIIQGNIKDKHADQVRTHTHTSHPPENFKQLVILKVIGWKVHMDDIMDK